MLLAAGVGTQSRAAFVALVAMVLVAVLTGLLALRYAGALLAVVTTAVALVIAVLPLPIGQALTDPQRYAETNIAQRNDIRLAAFEMTMASPVVGLGPGAFPLFHQDYRDDDDPDRHATSTPPTAPSSRPRPSSACSASWRCTPCGWCPPRPPAALAPRPLPPDRGVLLALDGLLDRLAARVRAVRPAAVVPGRHGARAGPSRPRPAPSSGRLDDRSSGQVAPRS